MSPPTIFENLRSNMFTYWQSDSHFANEAFVRLIALPFIFLVYSSVLAQQPASKAAIPDDAAQKAALAVVADVYKPDYEKAKTPAQKIELAKKLLEDGTATKDDSVSKFVLFRVARDIAAQQGDLAVSFDAIRRTSVEFEIDPIQSRIDSASIAVKALRLPKDHQACSALLAPLIDEAIAADRYDHAKLLAALTLGCAREGRDSDRIKQMTVKSKEIEEIAAEFERVKESKTVLEAKPTDPDANFAVGKFLCFVKGDWRRGVTMLALGSDEELKATALLELEAKPDSLRLGDAWWKIAESLEGTTKTRIQTYAGEWYRKALPGLSGLTKARVERLVAQVPTQQELDEIEPTKKPSQPKDAPMRKSPLVGVWGEPNGWRREFLEDGEARNITPKGVVDTVGKWQDEGRGNYSARLGSNNEWYWKMTLQGNALYVEGFLNGNLRGKGDTLNRSK